MLQENLKYTLAKFAASDADPKAYRTQLKSMAVIHIFSTTNFGCKVQNSVNPTLPPKPIVNMSSWSMVVRNRFKKTKAVQSPPQDKRLFIRLPNEHDWRKLSPAGIREIIVIKLFISPSAIGIIKPVRPGFALSPCTNEAREALLNAAIRLSLSGAKLESATNWTSVLIPTVPKSLHTLNGHVEVTKELPSQEIERVTKMRPPFLKLYGRYVLEAPYRTWMAFFTKAPRPNFRVLKIGAFGRTILIEIKLMAGI
ncbi:hypothetical protein EPUL_004121, partial [Erysiphe pulchra]